MIGKALALGAQARTTTTRTTSPRTWAHFGQAGKLRAALVVLVVVDLALYVLYNTYRQGKLGRRVNHDSAAGWSAHDDSIFRV